jgi:hypothetical protein
MAKIRQDHEFPQAVAGKTLLGEPNSPSTGVRVAMILHQGVPIELMEFESKP